LGASMGRLDVVPENNPSEFRCEELRWLTRSVANASLLTHHLHAGHPEFRPLLLSPDRGVFFTDAYPGVRSPLSLPRTNNRSRYVA